jgi:dephospho-CoA kinase
MSSRSAVYSLASLPDRWKHRAVPVLGLTGMIGGGKSEVATLLAKKGAVVIDADLVGHEVLERPEVRHQIIDRFGSEVIARGPGTAGTPGPICRRALGEIVFGSRSALDDLEAIVHPRMCQQFEQIIERESTRGTAPAVVLDAAILLEAGWDKLCDLVVFVDAPQPIRLERVAQGRGWTPEVLKTREAVQWSRDRKLSRANFLIQNNSSLESLDRKVDCLFRLVTDRNPLESAVSGASVASLRSSADTNRLRNSDALASQPVRT